MFPSEYKQVFHDEDNFSITPKTLPSLKKIFFVSLLQIGYVILLSYIKECRNIILQELLNMFSPSGNKFRLQRFYPLFGSSY